jgi:hypothetical protein
MFSAPEILVVGLLLLQVLTGRTIVIDFREFAGRRRACLVRREEEPVTYWFDVVC